MAALVLFCGSTAQASAANLYIAQSSTGAASGSDCSNALAYTFFNNSANWGSSPNQIGPGSTVHVCGTINGTGGSNGLTFRGSGTSGNVITLKFEPGAILQAPWWGSGGSSVTGAIVMSGVSFVTTDLGTNGLVRATLNGTPGGACPGGTCSTPAHDSNGVMFNNCSNCTLQNGEVGPIYLRTSLSDEASASTVGGRGVSKEGSCTNCTINNVNIHDVSALIEYDLPSGVSDSGLVVSNNNMHDTSAGIDVAQGSGENGTLSSFTFKGNSVHDFGSWNDVSPNYNFHHDGIHIYTYNVPISNISIYNNEWSGNLGNGTSWIYYENYSGGTANAVQIYNNLVDSYATSPNGAGSAHSIELQGSTSSDVINAVLYDNTIVGLSQSGTIMAGVYSHGPGVHMDMRNNTISGILQTLVEFDPTPALPNITTINNDYDFSGGGVIRIQNATDYNASNFSQWRTRCSCDSLSITSAPNLNSSYVPNAGSPLISAGVNLTGLGITLLNKDMKGVSRVIIGNWDIGAIASGGSASAPTPPSNLRASVQ
jgi:hypothetical protein